MNDSSINETTESIENELWRGDFYSRKRVRDFSDHNTVTNYFESEVTNIDDVFNSDVESLNFDSEWRLEVQRRNRESRRNARRVVKMNLKKPGFLRKIIANMVHHFSDSTEFQRMVVCSFIALVTALISVVAIVLIDFIVSHKHRVFNRFFEFAMHNADVFHIITPAWMILNGLIAAFGSIIIFQIEPQLGGSGVPELRSYINGVSVPRIVHFRSLVGRLVGLVIVPSADVPLGSKEPLMYIGGAIGAGLSQGRAPSFSIDFNILKRFRTYAEKRDFVVAGAAAGFCSGFGAPVAAVLFMIEQMSTSWKQAGVWRVMWTAIIASVTAHLIGKVWPAGNSMVRPLFGVMNNLHVDLDDVWLAAFVGAVGGVLGVAFNLINRAVNRLRLRYRSRGVRVAEAMLLTTGCVACSLLLLWLGGCRWRHQTGRDSAVGMACGDGRSNNVGLLVQQMPSNAFRALVLEPGHVFSPGLILAFAVYMMAGNAVVYGCNLCGGVIMPNFVIGAAWGRLVGHIFIWIFGPSKLLNIEKFAMFGAASQTAGVIRVVLTIPMMFVEASHSIQVGVVLAVASLFAKFVADGLWSVDFYSMWTRLLRLAYLPMEPDFNLRRLIALRRLRASDVMSHPVTYVRCTETVRTLLCILKNTPHNGFPVVSNETDQFLFGRLRGFVDRTTLLTLLEHKELYSQDVLVRPSLLSEDSFRRPRISSVETILRGVMEEDLDRRIVIADYMSIAPHVVQSHMSYMRVYAMFRTLGLRHLPVVTVDNNVVGVITRKDLLRYRWNVTNQQCPWFKSKMTECGFATSVSDDE